MDAEAIESLIQAVSEGTRPRADLMLALRSAKVAVLMDRGLENGTLPPAARPLSLNSPDGYPVLAVFSSVAKASPWVKNEPRYANALYTNFDWALGIVPAGVGIAVNPGYKHSLLLAPDEVRQLEAGAAANARGRPGA